MDAQLTRIERHGCLLRLTHGIRAGVVAHEPQVFFVETLRSDGVVIFGDAALVIVESRPVPLDETLALVVTVRTALRTVEHVASLRR